jgi:hypothetical protein
LKARSRIGELLQRRPLKQCHVTDRRRLGDPDGDDGIPHRGVGRVTFRAMESSVKTRRGRRALRFGALVVLALAAAVGVWLFVRDRNQGNSNTPTSPTPTGGRSSVVSASEQALARLSRLTRRPVYWAGPQRKMKLELTQTAGGRVYVRYLPLNVKIGDRRGRYLIVGTYPVVNAYRAIQKAAKESGAHRLRLRGGLLGVYNDSMPTNVYFAARRSNYQIEVYDPNPSRALALVNSGKIRPIRLKSSGG